jgi:hypothetical protein
LSDLDVMLRAIKTRANASNDLPAGDYREAALNLEEVACRDGCESAVIDRILQCLTRLVEQGSRSGLAWCESGLTGSPGPERWSHYGRR